MVLQGRGIIDSNFYSNPPALCDRVVLMNIKPSIAMSRATSRVVSLTGCAVCMTMLTFLTGCIGVVGRPRGGCVFIAPFPVAAVAVAPAVVAPVESAVVAAPATVSPAPAPVTPATSMPAPAPTVAQDEYVYYPGYELYYCVNRQQCMYLQNGVWVAGPVPQGIDSATLFASPSVKMNFHDSPMNHHAVIAQKYPKNWMPH